MSDDPYYFYRFQPTSGASLYDIVISHQGLAANFCFTVQALSNVKLEIEDGPPPLPYSASVQGAWSGLTAGGNHTCSTFLYNPQYRITLSSPPGQPNATGELEAFAETSKDSPINVKILYNGGKRVADFEDRDVLAGVATYSYGPGSYTLVVSSFQAIHEASFDLVVRSSLPVQVAPIPSEGAGMYSRSMSGSWSEGLDGGSNAPMRNPTFKLDLTKPTGMKIRLQTPEGPLPIAISVYSANPDGSAHTQVFSTVPYSDLVCGVVTPMLHLELAAAGYLVIPSTFSSGLHTSFHLFVYADAPFELGEITATSPLDGSAPDLVTPYQSISSSGKREKHGSRTFERAFNTSAAEQLNSSLSGFTHLLQSMKAQNYDFLVHVILRDKKLRREREVGSEWVVDGAGDL
ncbi:hypothetical protein JCM1841_000694 [Sporobolomyces salmonicolor]